MEDSHNMLSKISRLENLLIYEKTCKKSICVNVCIFICISMCMHVGLQKKKYKPDIAKC